MLCQTHCPAQRNSDDALPVIKHSYAAMTTYPDILDHLDGWSLDRSKAGKELLGKPWGHVDGTVEEHLFHEEGHFGLVHIWESLDDPVTTV